MTSSSSIIPTRTAPTGPRKGSGEIISAAEAPLMQRMSCGVTMSADSVVQITCTSFLKPFGQSGRIGRSIIRAVRIAFSPWRPSRLKKPPGIFPAAYIRSSTSMVSGKKSAPSRPSVRPWAVARTIVSPERTTTAPSACFASLPVSKVISRPPTVTPTETGAFCCSASTMLISIPPLCFVEGGGLSQPPRAATASSLKPPPSGGLTELPPEAQLLDEGAVPLEILLLQVIQEPAPPADELQQSTPRVVILRVRPQMLGEAVDALGQHRDLDFRRAGVRLVLAERLRCVLLRFLGEGHAPPCSSRRRPSRRRARKTRTAGTRSARRVAMLRWGNLPV